LEYIKINEGKISQKVIGEMEHDLNRLHLITDRFSKIGSEPSLQVENLYEVLEDSVSYIDSRTSEKVDITIESPEVLNQINILVNRPLFAWVIENLCKNAVDAMNGEGKITFRFISEKIDEVVIEVEDTGKGMPSNRFKTIFKPGYTTKKRGWGLGLSLVKRIVENYHNGKIYVKSSVIGAGTKFRIELPRANENATT
jgi:signal transduction histidine kinase